MTDQSVSDLGYGHLGRAVYDVEGKKWLLNRQPGQLDTFEALPQVRSSLPHSHLAPSLSQPPIVQSSDGLRHRVHRLVRHIPELQPGVTPLVSLAKISEAVAISRLRYNSTQGELLSYGRAADIDNKRSKGKVKIAAFPGGACGGSLRLVRVRSEYYGWENKNGVGFEAPYFSNGETAWWAGDGAPIEQVCFAKALDERSTFLAVRLPTSTIFFRPLYRRHPVPPGNVRLGCTYSPSKLDANQILEVPMSLTGTVPHADVTFNPWYQRQCAIIDQCGKWFIVDIEGQKRKRLTYRAAFGQSGCVVDTVASEDETTPHPHDDGWARIIWAGDVDTIVVCNRRHIAAIDIRGESKQLAHPDMGTARSSDRILDVRRSCKHLDHIFVLTSSRVFWLRIVGVSGLDRQNNTSAGAHTLLCWNHFRDTEDLSLRLSVVAEDKETTVLVYSRLNILITRYRVSTPSSGRNISASLSDPTELRLPVASHGESQQESVILDLVIEPLSHWEDLSREADLAVPRANDEASFYDLKLLVNNLAIDRCIVGASWGPTFKIALPRYLRQRKARYSATTIKDEFIADDGMDDANDGSGPRRLPPSSRRHRRKTVCATYHHEEHEDDDPWTVANERAYNEICKDRIDQPIALEDQRGIDDHFVQLLERIRTGLAPGPGDAERILGTLFEHCELVPAIGDIDTASTAFQDLLQISTSNRLVEASGVSVKPVASASVLGWSNRDGGLTSLPSVYSGVISYALGHLPLSTPNRYRLVKERMVRQVIAELTLASTKVAPSDSSLPAQSFRDVAEAEMQGGDNGGLSLPVRLTRKGKDTASADFISLDSSQYGSQAFTHTDFHLPPVPPFTALPTPSATPSLVSGSTFVSTGSERSMAPYNVLREYVTFTRQPPPFPVNMDKILSHWHVGADPSTYNYITTHRIIDTANNSEIGGMSVGQRARLQRKAERHLHRQRRETAAAKKTTAMSASQPALLSTTAYRSSPASVLPTLQSSMQAVPSQVSAVSQVIAGPYGGRPVKRRKVQRMHGF